jgi:hypothetical protein
VSELAQVVSLGEAIQSKSMITLSRCFVLSINAQQPFEQLLVMTSHEAIVASFESG